MYQAWVTRVFRQGGRVMVEAKLAANGRVDSRYYVMEIVVDRGQFLSIPNEAIIEEGDKQIVYVQQQPGQYTPHEIQTGIQGELYTQVLKGLNEGDQVVTFGSFFIDSEYKLKGTEQAPMSSEPLHRP
jgi:multidrug efflux pump subunit AcrA (membrane-fusion protein)